MKKRIGLLFAAILFFLPPDSTASTNLSNLEELQSAAWPLYVQSSESVDWRIRKYAKASSSDISILTERGKHYFPIIDQIFAEEGIPHVLRYVAAVESSLRPHVRSPRNAVGLWQFTASTGRMYGLKINGQIDERRNALLATRAAAKYLNALYDRFHDWNLVVAAYNCGPGRVQKAQRKSGSSTYWELESFLPRETRNYLPKLLALTVVFDRLEPEPVKAQPVQVRLPHQMSLEELATMTLVDRHHFSAAHLGKYHDYIFVEATYKDQVQNALNTYVEATKGERHLIAHLLVEKDNAKNLARYYQMRLQDLLTLNNCATENELLKKPQVLVLKPMSKLDQKFLKMGDVYGWRKIRVKKIPSYMSNQKKFALVAPTRGLRGSYLHLIQPYLDRQDPIIFVRKSF